MARLRAIQSLSANRLRPCRTADIEAGTLGWEFEMKGTERKPPAKPKTMKLSGKVPIGAAQADKGSKPSKLAPMSAAKKKER